MSTDFPANMSNESCNINLVEDRVGLIVIYTLAFSLGLPANLLSLWGLYQLGSSGGGVQLVLILNLLLSDLLQMLTLPLWMVYLQEGHRWPYSPATCNFVGYLFYINMYASVAFLTLVALDRYLAICHPLGSRDIRTIRVAVLAGLIVWVLVVIFCLVGLYPSVFEEKSRMCLEKYPVRTGYACFKIVTVVMGFLIPCSVLGYTSAHIRIALRSSPSVSDQTRHKIVGTLAIITIIFVAVFGPYHLVGGYKFLAFLLTDNKCGLERSLFLCYRLSYGLTSLNGVLDPLFYIFMCHDIREELQRSLPCLGKGSERGNMEVQLVQSEA